jgi:tetratricopeptide (TPR) repeat protein
MPSSSVALPSAERPRPAWIVGPLYDLPWIVLCPLLALVVMEALWGLSGLSDDAIYTVLFAFVVTGHHMPGWLRAFLEPAVYERHKAKLWASALFIPAMILVPAAYGLGMLVAAVGALFDLWHTSLQHHGFARIYSGKAGDTDRGAARLELACILVWYVTVVAFSDAWAAGIAETLHHAGIGVFDAMTPGAWRAVKAALGASSALCAVLYVRHAIAVFREKRVFALHKHVLHLTMIGVAAYAYRAGSWYRAQSVQNLFHAVQYIGMVWVFGHLGLRRGATAPGRAYRLLFGSRASALVFGAAVLAYGGLSMYWPKLFAFLGGGPARHVEMAGALVYASLFLHFYVDSFIWKVRDGDVRKALAIGPGGEGAAPPSPSTREHVRGALHAAAYFGVPILLVAIVGAGRRAPSPEAEAAFADRMAEIFPGSAVALERRGLGAFAANDLVEARRWLERAFAIAPTLDGPALDLARLDRLEGRAGDAVVHLHAAVSARPGDVGLRLALASALVAVGARADAEDELRDAMATAPDAAEPHADLAELYAMEGRGPEAEAERARAAELAARHAEKRDEARRLRHPSAPRR